MVSPSGCTSEFELKLPCVFRCFATDSQRPTAENTFSNEANSIIKALMKLETVFLVAFWSCVLKSTNMTSKLLQSEKADLGSSVSLLKSLSAFIGKLRDRSKFDEFVEAGKDISGSPGFSEKRTKYSRRTADDVCARGVIVSTSEEFRIPTFLATIDSLLLDLDKRIKAYSMVDELFLFLRHIDVDAEVSLKGVVDFYSKD